MCESLKAVTASAWMSQRANPGAWLYGFAAIKASVGVRLLTLCISAGFNMLVLHSVA